MKRNWWKILCVVLFLYAVIYGLTIEVPDLNRLHQTIRNLFYHVPLWFGMIFILLISFIYSIRYLSSGKEEHDIVAIESVKVGLLFGILGFITGSFWGNYSWGEISAWLTSEPRSLASMIAMLFYVAYIILRGSLEEMTKRAKISAVYNVFAFVLYLLFIIVVPRLTESLHPGAGGNPGFNIYDSDNNLKVVLYPAWMAYMLLALWITNIRVRMRKIELKTLTNDF